ncbi:Rossmann-like and DUF2520 domain-containing protein [Flavobacterium sp. ASW18X]|uniref:Rossmann-like and DUF2520 domain-containing protein n=1 Tax=Flavobacterium sp. ASW18X TaxID=2572595 RepID=UPI0010AE57A2|nr:DUF2520 domain-containing protein [Flavobacterium sp. ASW18X]TKD66238.1 DUF2520 domain-containing protein [Flavobacterium sp. ASW18X]
MLTVVLIGTGNVAGHLYHQLLLSNTVKLVQVFGRSSEALTPFSEVATTTNYKELYAADVCIIAVKDSAIAEVSKELKHLKGIIVHTSGTQPMSVLNNAKVGVFYPLQTFTKNKQVDFRSIPFLLEANEETTLETLKLLAQEFTENIHLVNSEQRKQLHVAAVLVNNFSNHLFYWAEDLCKEQNLPFAILLPLIKETVAKLETLSPKAAQTGPAVRKDTETMQKHIALLTEPLQKKIYQLMSESIIATYEKKL